SGHSSTRGCPRAPRCFCRTTRTPRPSSTLAPPVGPKRRSWNSLRTTISPTCRTRSRPRRLSARRQMFPRSKLAKIDLLPRIRHKVLITPELAPMFRGRDDELLDRFKIITRVLDGQGLQTDKGTHGRRGYRGDYLFGWIGATTPIEDKIFRLMEALGARLFFHEAPSEPVTVDQLAAASEGETYRDRLQRCKDMVHWFLSELFATWAGVRGVILDATPEDRALREGIARWATAVSAMRSVPAREPDPQRGASGVEYMPAS